MSEPSGSVRVRPSRPEAISCSVRAVQSILLSPRCSVRRRLVGSCERRPEAGGHTYLLGLLSIVLAPVEAEEEEEEEQAVRADVPEGDGRVVALAEHQLERVRHDRHELDLRAEGWAVSWAVTGAPPDQTRCGLHGPAPGEPRNIMSRCSDMRTSGNNRTACSSLVETLSVPVFM